MVIQKPLYFQSMGIFPKALQTIMLKTSKYSTMGVFHYALSTLSLFSAALDMPACLPALTLEDDL
jgi:hypothetical protein